MLTNGAVAPPNHFAASSARTTCHRRQFDLLEAGAVEEALALGAMGADLPFALGELDLSTQDQGRLVGRACHVAPNDVCMCVGGDGTWPVEGCGGDGSG